MADTLQFNERHFLQSPEWERFQAALGREVFRGEGDGWSYLAILEKGNKRGAAKRLYVPYGPTVVSQQALQLALADLKRLGEKHKASYVRFEPLPIGNTQLDVLATGAIKAARESQPALTLLIDLDRSHDEIIQGMTKTNRYLWRRYREGKTELEVHVAYEQDKLAPFLGMMHETAARNHAIFHDDHYYRKLFQKLAPEKSVGLAYALHKGMPVAGVFFFDDLVAKRRYYAYAASFETARDLSANPPLVAFVILDACTRGMKVFDFFGVSPAEDSNHRWAGFSKFKRSFGGNDFAFCGTYELPVKKLHYKVNDFARKVINVRRKTFAR